MVGVKLVSLLVVVLLREGAQAQTTTPVYSLVANSPKNNAGHTLEEYLNSPGNVEKCLKSAATATFATDVVPGTSYKGTVGSDPWTKAPATGTTVATAVGTKWMGVYSPAGGNKCISDADQTTPPTTCNPAATGTTWPGTDFPTVCAYTDLKKANCAPLLATCYTAWQTETPATTTTTTGPTTTTTTTAAAPTVKPTAAPAPTAKPAAAATAKPAAAAAAKPAASSNTQAPIVIVLQQAGTGGGAAQPSRAATPLPPPPTGCVDGHTNCGFWMRAGECSKNAAYMNLYCKQSCGACSAATSAPTTGGSGGCRDTHELCNFWAKMNQCTENKAWMETGCCKSCQGKMGGGSTGGGSSGCMDKNDLCSFWASKAQCTENSDYMDVYCKKACKKC